MAYRQGRHPARGMLTQQLRSPKAFPRLLLSFVPWEPHERDDQRLDFAMNCDISLDLRPDDHLAYYVKFLGSWARSRNVTKSMGRVPSF